MTDGTDKETIVLSKMASGKIVCDLLQERPLQFDKRVKRSKAINERVRDYTRYN